MCFCICCTYVCVRELGVALRVFSHCLGEKQRGRKRVYGVVTATPDDPGGHLWKKTPEQKISKARRNYSWTVGRAAQRHTKNPCLINPPRQRRHERREGLSERACEQTSECLPAKKTCELKTSTFCTPQAETLAGLLQSNASLQPALTPELPLMEGKWQESFLTGLNRSSSSCYDAFLSLAIQFREIKLESRRQNAEICRDLRTEMPVCFLHSTIMP